MLTCKKHMLMHWAGTNLPPSHILLLLLKTKWGRLDNQMRFFGSIKLLVSAMFWVKISVVDLAPVDSPKGILARKKIMSAYKPHEC